ncbi:PLD nuclease N-terminal domain-containing protein [Pseudomonas sp. PSKL.D1]|uniref:PLD nuclease N-terminal domain-containing protein n=1 Tax=Pseudomonas sp. PSKL.D1 TaxID=3029060 RepID=UPI002380EE86|nr:PLD nuclease N-terminal domain-containing protein [Pseudomonas sp. PSKL.D1]WDY56648.1 PLD nuclease N-terminal domain-containing protein [Pseudomonas sp. PSKL.D1]
MGSTFNSVVGLALLALMIWAALQVIKSASAVAIKLVWILLIALFPVVGLIIWAIAGPRGNQRS